MAAVAQGCGDGGGGAWQEARVVGGIGQGEHGSVEPEAQSAVGIEGGAGPGGAGGEVDEGEVGCVVGDIGADGRHKVERGAGGEAVEGDGRVGECQQGIVANEGDGDAVGGYITRVFEVECHGHGVAGIERCRGEGGDHGEGAVRLYHLEGAEGGAVLLSRGREGIGAHGEVGRKRKQSIAGSIGEDGGYQRVGHRVNESHIGVGGRGDGERRGAVGDGRRGVEGNGGSLGHVRHHRGVAHEVIDFPIVPFHGRAGGGALDGHVALHHHRPLRGAPLGVGLVMGVEGAVVDTEIGGVIGHRHRGANAAADAHGPIEVLSPIGAVAAADVAHSAGIVAFAEQGLAEAGALLELVGEAAVANHEAELLVVGHLVDMAVAEVGCTPPCGAAMGGIVDEASAEVVVGAHGGGIAGGAARECDVGGAGRDDGYIVLKVVYVGPSVGAIDIVGDGVIHGRVAIGVAVVAGIARVDACHHHGAVEEGGVGESVLLVHQGFEHLGFELGESLSREAAVVTVGDVVATGPCHVVEVGDMVVRDAGAMGVEGGELSHVAHEQHIGRCGVGEGGVGVEAFDIGGDGGGVGTHAGVAGVDDVCAEALALFPLDKGVEVAAEHVVGHDEEAHGGCGTHDFGIEAVQGLGTTVEGRRVVAVEQFPGAFHVGALIADGQRGMAADDDLAAHGVITHGRKLEARQTAVAGDAHCLDQSLLLSQKGIR